MSDNHHLQRRNGRYYYRRRVPEDVAAVIGRTVIKFSLGTSDKGKAKQARAVADVEWDVQFQAARTRSAEVTTHDQCLAAMATATIVRKVRDFVEMRAAAIDRRLSINGPANEAERLEMIVDAGLGVQALRNLDDHNGDVWVDRVGREIAAAVGLPPNAEIDAYARRGLIEVQRRKLAVLEGRYDNSFFDPMFDPRGEPRAGFGDVADQFAAEQRATAKANDRGLQRVHQVQTYVSLLKEIVGADTDIRAVNYDTCLGVRSTLARVPLNRTKLYGRTALAQAIERADAENRRRLSPLTQKQHLAAFRCILGLAAKKRLIPINFAQDLTPVKRDAVPRGEKRDPFSQAQIKTIFTTGFYAEAAKVEKPYAIDDKGWRFWLPLLTLYMGLRPNEAAQLDVADLKLTDEGTWYVDLTETDAAESTDDTEAARKTLKTSLSRRRVPVHPELLSLGFVDFVETRMSGTNPRLFPTLKPNRFGNVAWYAVRRFNEAFLPSVIELGPKQSYYSLRHSFRDALRRAEANSDVLHAFGWSQGNLVSNAYGERSNPDWLAKFMPKIEYEGLTLAHLRPHRDLKVR